MKYLIPILICGAKLIACETCDEIKAEVLSKIASIVSEYNQDYDDVGIIHQTLLVGRLQSYLELNDKFFKVDYSSLNECD